MSDDAPGDANAMRFVDNHCHLDDDAAITVAAAAEAGVTTLIDVGCDLVTSQAAVARAEVHDAVWATVGLHPHEAKHGLDGLEALLESSRVVAVGECGLDFHYDHSPRDVQRDMFVRQIAMAHRHELPLVIHTREAWEETFDVLDREGVPDQTIFHCFTGGPDEAQRCLELGGWLSFSGIVSFKSAADVQAAAAMCPRDRMLVETDSPYLAPVPHRGKQNRPAWVVAVAEALAQVRSESTAAVASATWANAHRAYPRLVS